MKKIVLIAFLAMSLTIETSVPAAAAVSTRGPDQQTAPENQEEASENQEEASENQEEASENQEEASENREEASESRKETSGSREKISESQEEISENQEETMDDTGKTEEKSSDDLSVSADGLSDGSSLCVSRATGETLNQIREALEGYEILEPVMLDLDGSVASGSVSVQLTGISLDDPDSTYLCHIAHFGKEEQIIERLPYDYDASRKAVSFRTVSFSPFVFVRKNFTDPIGEALKKSAQQNTAGKRRLQGMMKAARSAGSNTMALNGDEQYVSRFSTSKVRTGTAPFDSSDTAGNDSSETNSIIRSFDMIEYTLKLSSESYTAGRYYRSGYIHYCFVLPQTQEEAEFRTSDMPWMVSGTGTANDWKITSEKRNIDGQEKSCQVLYASQYLDASAACVSSVFPCVDQTVNAIIYVKGMANGSSLKPQFYAWIDHNTTKGTCAAHGVNEVRQADESSSQKNITVSAAPSYSIAVNVFDEDADYETLNFSEGTDDAPEKDAGTLTGTAFSVGTEVILRGSSHKGLRGVEVPKGEISFDLTLRASFSEWTNITPAVHLFWADENTENAGKKFKRGLTESGLNTVLNRNLPYSVNPHDWDNYQGDRDWYNSKSCHKSGDVTAVKTGQNALHVTVSNYQINPDHFPRTIIAQPYKNIYYNKGDKAYETLEKGVFSAHQYQIFVAYPRERISNQSMKLSLTASVSNISIASASGTPGRLSDNISSDTGTYELFRSAWFNGNNNSYTTDYDYYLDPRGHTVSWQTKDDNSFIGNHIGISFDSAFKNYRTGYLYGYDQLMKFDASALTPDGTCKNRSQCVNSEPFMTAYSYTVLFAACKSHPQSDWSSEREKRYAGFSDMIYYRTLSDLKKAGSTCCGILLSVREIPEKRHFYGWLDSIGVMCPFTINNQTSLDRTAHSIMSCSCAYFYAEGKQPTLPTYADYYFDHKSLPSPSLQRSSSYEMAAWSHDRLSTEGRNNGDTLYIKNYNVKIAKSIEQTDQKQAKNIFNLDTGETVADYRLDPGFNCRNDEISQRTTNVTVTDTLPAGVTYNDDAVLGGRYIPNAAGAGKHGSVEGGTKLKPSVSQSGSSTVLKWTFTNVRIRDGLPSIHYSVTINRAKAENNQEYQGTASIISTEDDRALSEINGNYHTCSFRVSKNSGLSLTNTAVKDVVKAGEDVGFRMTWCNYTVHADKSLILADTMPWEGTTSAQNAVPNYHGSYKIRSLKISSTGQTRLDLSQFSLYYTELARYHGVNAGMLATSGTESKINITDANEWKKTAVSSDGTVGELSGKKPSVWCLVGDLPESAEITADLRLETEGSRGNDMYINYSSMKDSTAHALVTREPAFTADAYIDALDAEGNIVSGAGAGTVWIENTRTNKTEADPSSAHLEEIQPGSNLSVRWKTEENWYVDDIRIGGTSDEKLRGQDGTGAGIDAIETACGTVPEEGEQKTGNCMRFTDIQENIVVCIRLRKAGAPGDGDSSKTGSSVTAISKEVFQAPEGSSGGSSGRNISGQFVNPGQKLFYTISYANISSRRETITITDTIPDGTTLDEKSCSVDNTTVESGGSAGKAEITVKKRGNRSSAVVWRISDVTPGTKGTVSFGVQVGSGDSIPSGGTISNVAEASTKITGAQLHVSYRTDPVCNYLAVPNLKITDNSGTGNCDGKPAAIGQPLHYTISFRNPSNRAVAFTVTDQLPSSMSLLAETGKEYCKTAQTKDTAGKPAVSVSWTRTIAAGQTFSESITARPTDVGEIRNMAVVSADDSSVPSNTVSSLVHMIRIHKIASDFKSDASGSSAISSSSSAISSSGPSAAVKTEKALKGAGFILKKVPADGDGQPQYLIFDSSLDDSDPEKIVHWTKSSRRATVFTTDDSGYVSVSGMGSGNYELVETVAPPGYMINPNPVNDATSSVTVSSQDQLIQSGHAEDGSAASVWISDVTCIDHPVMSLPNTGGTGIAVILLIAAGCILLSVLIPELKKKRHKP